ncbi:FimV/HubP family polar landmark protein [Vibrio scophthalmi]|uniref:FimV/HubP family polar landmark protein n=1 Tax=Vibrio scophthalmi TaxID=45658 RepID=UPI003AAB6557
MPTVDNEFGTPSDDDWLFDGDSDTADALAALQEQTPAAPLEQVNETAQIDDSHNEPLTLEPAQSAEPEFEPELDFVEQDAETVDVAEVEPVASEGDGSQHIDSVDAPDAPLPEPEPESEHEEQAESVDVANDLPFEFDELELPEFGEEEALADAVEHPAADDAQANESSSSASEEALDEPQDESQAASSDAFDEIIGDGVYDNEAASDEAHSTETVSPENMANEEIANDKRDSGEAPIEPQAEALETEPQIAQSDAEERFDFDDLDLPEYGEDDAIADFKAEMPNQAASMANELSTEPAFNSESELSDVDGETRFSFDDLELPEYGEADALADATAEMEQDSDVALAEAPVANEVVTQTPEPAPELSQEQTQELPQTQSDEVFEFDTADNTASDITETFESAADPVEAEAAEQGSAEQEPAEIRDGEMQQQSTAEEPESAPSFNFNDLEPVDIDNAELDQRLDEQDVLSGLFGDASSLEPAPLEPQEHRDNAAIKSDYDESAFNELLAEGDDSYTPVEKPIDQRASDSAGMDIDAMLEMGGEDWNGFSLSPELQASISDDIPEEDRHAWDEGNQPAQAKISNEDWENQDDLIDFNPRDNQYRTIDELMAEVDREEGLFNPDEEALKLDVGLSDFPDVIGQMSDIDVDSNAEASGKLDLAKIYMEMNDASGAKKLLEEAIVDGNDDIRREAKRLIDAINGR